MIIQHSSEAAADPDVETILILAANPDDQPYLNLEHEITEIRKGLSESRRPFIVHEVPDATPQDLQELLYQLRPTYVHFCGHGTGTGSIALQGQLVSDGALANLFRLFATTIKCVVLNACHSEVQARAIVRHIDHVVAMNKEIGDSAAIEFAGAFYRAIGAGEDLDTAVRFGRSAIQLADLPEHLTPELLERDPNGPPRLLSRKYRDWDGAPAVSLLYGRESTADTLRSWILDDRCRIVLITGMRGIGKSDLASCVGRGANRGPNTNDTLASGVESFFEAVLWRSLLNAPSPAQLFAEILGVLVTHNGPLPLSPEERMKEVLHCLNERRCLVVLDNMEAVLRPDMGYLDGFELYKDFLNVVAGTDHKSCLLLTSREPPPPITELYGDGKAVRLCSLQGIDSGSVQRIFARISSFEGSTRSWEEIGVMYGGNPLSMELVARHINEVYYGDVDAFLADGHSVFGDVTKLLDWHFERLSDAELEIIEWLAIEREPVSRDRLRDNLLSRKSRDDVPSTIQALRRRMPLDDREKQQITLQPVLIEYATASMVKRISEALRKAIQQSVHSLSDGGSPDALLAALRMLNSRALIKASARDNVREMQTRLILGPIMEDIGSEWGREQIRDAFDSMLHLWRGEIGSRSGYAAGNILNLLAGLGIALDEIDVSNLAVWQACLNNVNLHEARFSGVNFRHTSFRHAFGTVFSVGYSPNGRLIAAGDDNGSVRMFDATSGELRQTLTGHADTVGAIAFSADGRIMASGSYDNTICLWDVANGHRTNTLLKHRGWVYAVAISPNGRSLASASEDGTCLLWDLQTGVSRRLDTPGATFLATVAFSPDGRFLAAGGGGGILYLFDMDDLDHPRQLPHHRGGIRSVTFAHQRDLIATGGEDGRVAVWQTDGTLLASLEGHTGNVMSVSFSAVDDVLASASVDKTVRLWSTDTNACLAQLQGGDTRVWAVACSPAGRTLAVASEDGTIRTWDMNTRQPLMTLHGYSNKTWGIAYSENRSRLVAGSEDGVVRVWDTRDWNAPKELRGHATRVWGVACSPDGRWAASVSDDGTVRLWDLETDHCRHVWRGHTGWVRAVAFEPASQRVASVAEDGNLFVWDVADGAEVLRIPSGIPRLFAAAFCRSSSLIAVAGSESYIRLFSAADGSHVADLQGHDGWVRDVVAIGETSLASCGADGSIAFWDLANMMQTGAIRVGPKVWCAVVADGGESLVAGAYDGVLRRWNVETGRCEAERQAHRGPIWSIAVNHREQTVATAGDDGLIRLWSLPELRPVAPTNALRAPRPYEGMDVTKAEGLGEHQKEALEALGAINLP